MVCLDDKILVLGFGFDKFTKNFKPLKCLDFK